MKDTPENRSSLEAMWREIVARLLDKDVPALVVCETMSTVAIEQLVNMSGAYEAATYLRLLADQIVEQRRHEDSVLMEGREP